MDTSGYEYLWENENYEYVLVKTTLGYMIINRVTNGALLIENEKLEKEIIKQMLHKGVPIYNSHGALINKGEPINIVGQPTQPDDFPEKRYKISIEWSKDVSLIVQVKELKKAFPVVNSQSNQNLINIAKTYERWQFDILYLDESRKANLLNLAKKHGLKIVLELDELREWF